MNAPEAKLDADTAAQGSISPVPGGAEATAYAAPPAAADATMLDLQRFTLMLVDDDPIMLDTVQAYLESYGYGRFITTSDPRTAMDLLVRHRPDILLLDLSMPAVSGFDILAQTRAHEELRYTPVIILTGESDALARLRALELGATDFLTKPVDPSELVLRVRNVLAFKAYQDRLAETDLLTGLPNRRTFFAAVARALASPAQSATGSALLHIDLDRFMEINDKHGRKFGDRVLCTAGQVIEQVLETAHRPPSDQSGAKLICARIGGNGFGVLVPDQHSLTQAEDATGLARRILNAFSEPLRVDGSELQVSVSVGVALSPADGEDADSLLRHAEMAMYLAKRRGRDTYAFFAKDVNSRAVGGMTLENELKQAIDRGALLLYFQPKVDLSNARIAGVEVLPGWKHPERGIFTPEQFVAAAEQVGLMSEVDRWVLRAACTQLSAWGQQGLPPLAISVNVSHALVKRGAVWDTVRGALDRSGVLPQRLVLEFDEAVLMDNASTSLAMLRELDQMGLRLALDNVGSGYSSFAYLSRSPLAELKIDPALIAGLPGDRDSGVAVSAMLAMAERLDLKVTATGVENSAQLEFLRGQRCHAYQGPLCSRPVTGDALLQLLRRSLGAS
jgi:diguanylate cyclase (GGDEF)-like protein